MQAAAKGGGPGVSELQGQEGREVSGESAEPRVQQGSFGRNRQDCMGPGSFAGASLSSPDGAARNKQTLLFPVHKWGK